LRHAANSPIFMKFPFIVNFTEKLSLKILWLSIGLYVFVFSSYSYFKFISFSYFDFDLAVHAQALWNIIHGSSESSILGINFLGNHAHFISFLIAPIYFIAPHPLTLLFLQTLSLGLSAYPIYLIARKALDYRWATAIAVIYLCYPALGYVNLFEFHPTAFATLFLGFTLYYFYTKNFSKFLIFAFLSMICQENIPLAIIALGLYALFIRRTLKWVLVPIVAGTLYFLLCVKVFLPYFNSNTIQFSILYSHLGNSPQEILKTIFFDPVKMLLLIFSPEKIFYFFEVFGPLGFLPFFSPLSLLISLPFFLQHLLSQRPNEVTLYFHYMAEIIPLIFFAFILGIQKLLKRGAFQGRQKILIGSLAALILSFNIFLGPQTQSSNGLKYLHQSTFDRQKEQILSLIPPGASVAATFEFLPRLTSRKELYSLHHIYDAKYTLSTKPYEIPGNIQYLLLDAADQMTFSSFYGAASYRNLQNFLQQDPWGAIEIKNTVVLWKKNANSVYDPHSVLKTAPGPQYPLHENIGKDLIFLGYDVNDIGGDQIYLTLYWQCINKISDDIDIIFDIVDRNGTIDQRLIHPAGYRIFPTQSWQPGQWIKEDHVLLTPKNYRRDKLSVEIGFSSFFSKKSYDISDHTFGRIPLTGTKVK